MWNTIQQLKGNYTCSYVGKSQRSYAKNKESGSKGSTVYQGLGPWKGPPARGHKGAFGGDRNVQYLGCGVSDHT